LLPAELVSGQDRERARQARSNRNSLASYRRFAGHRQRLTQTILQLALRRELSAEHPWLGALSYTLTLTHLRTLSALTRPGRRALFVSDVASEQMAPLAALDPDADDVPARRARLRELLAQLVLAGQVFDSVDPLLLSQLSVDDPVLAQDLVLHPIEDVWLWQVTALRRYLTYALVLERTAG
jgi:hypothetical protein